MFFRLTPITKNLLILNVGVFIIQAMTGTQGFIENSPVTEYGAMYPIAGKNFMPFQVITHMFLHGGFTHLLFNMLPVLFFGPMLESALGQKRFLIMYMVCGIGAGLFYSGVQYLEWTVRLQDAPEGATQYVFDNLNGMVGASGAVFGILMMAALLFPNTRIMLLFPPIPMKMKYFALMYGILELVQGAQFNPRGNVAHFAHVGGMLFAFILLQIWKRQARK